MNLNDVVHEVVIIAKEAGDAILQIYNQPEFHIENKADSSPLTEADRQANEIICRSLLEKYPDIPIISEENKMESYNIRKEYQMCWMVDPLDGTKEFIHRNGDFTVNIALIREGEPVLGVVYQPVNGDLYYADKETGAFSTKNGITSALKTTPFSIHEKGLKVVASRSHLNEETAEFIQKLSEPALVTRGSSLKFLLLASGEADIYPRLAPTSEWDTAAAQCILMVAGGVVINVEDGNPMVYNKPSLLNPSFIAYRHPLNESLI
jgi:3'(2'), 5'-bisphosphate nucleotidase